MKPINIVPSQNKLGEGPLWSVKEQAIYWVDIDGKKIQRFYPETKKYEYFEMQVKVCLMAFRKKGGMICGTEDGFYFWDPVAQGMDFITHPEKGKKEARFNDGKVDRKGRLWAGTMTFKGATSALYRMDSDLSVNKMISKITISNGIGWSPDNHIMYYVDSLRYVIYAFNYDLATGTINNQRPFVQMDSDFGIPDGLTVDSEGYIWCAIYGGWKIMRYDPSGNIAAEIQMPVSQPSSCTFGGKELDELYITSISEGLTEEDKVKEPMAGDLFMVKTDVKGLPEPDFAG
ncbi:MAG: SMP-30/gluconolactonase/LRE family protein [Thermoproteota archaeon]|nr:MAG: SMP-30/gluconolactonase/LRE family protein [Candidatus Korarchaeota archaeon]